jgi:hypothetical protein
VVSAIAWPTTQTSTNQHKPTPNQQHQGPKPPSVNEQKPSYPIDSLLRRPQNQVGYSRAWDALSDLDLASPGQVRLIYSGGTAPVQTGCPNNKCEWNREHLWPQSYGVDPEDKNSGRAPKTPNPKPQASTPLRVAI